MLVSGRFFAPALLKFLKVLDGLGGLQGCCFEVQLTMYGSLSHLQCLSLYMWPGGIGHYSKRANLLCLVGCRLIGHKTRS